MSLTRVSQEKNSPRTSAGTHSGLRMVARGFYGRFLMTVLGLRRWRSHEELVALAQHLEHDVFPSLREQGVEWLEIAVPEGDDGPLASIDGTFHSTFIGTERLGIRLREEGVRKLRLSTQLESGQVVESILLLLFSATAREKHTANESGYSGWHPERIAAAMQSPEGYLKFCARMTYDPQTGVFESQYTYCELGVTRALARYIRRNKRFGDHRVLFHEAPRIAVLLALLLAVPLALFYGFPTLFVPVYLVVVALVGLAGAVAVYTLGAYEYGREHRDLLINSHVDQVRQLNREVSAQNAKLEKANSLKDLLLKAGAHDIRNPLLQIMLRAESLLIQAQDRDDEKCAKEWRRVLLHAERIRGIVDNFLNLQRIQEGKLHTNAQPLEIQNVVRSVVASRQAELDHRNLDVAVECSSVAPLAEGDHTCAKETLQNYLGNAIKFSPESSKIVVRLSGSEEAVRVEVADEGPGVPKEERAQLFQEFARISNRPQNGEASTGLGLAVARQLMEVQGGRVGAEFPESGGSVFWFELPAYRSLEGS